MEYQKNYPSLKANYDDVVKRVAADIMLESLRKDAVAVYGVKVTTSPTAPTEQLLRYMQMDAMNQSYPGIIPPDIMIDATDLPNKDEIISRIRQQQAQMEQQQAQMEQLQAQEQQQVQQQEAVPA